MLHLIVINFSIPIFQRIIEKEEEELLMTGAEMGKEDNEIPLSVITGGVIGRSTMAITETPIFVPEKHLWLNL